MKDVVAKCVLFIDWKYILLFTNQKWMTGCSNIHWPRKQAGGDWSPSPIVKCARKTKIFVNMLRISVDRLSNRYSDILKKHESNHNITGSKNPLYVIKGGITTTLAERKGVKLQFEYCAFPREISAAKFFSRFYLRQHHIRAQWPPPMCKFRCCWMLGTTFEVEVRKAISARHT